MKLLEQATSSQSSAPSRAAQARARRRKHPAEIVLAALLAGRAVQLPDGRTYRLGDDLSVGVPLGPSGDDGFVLPRDLQLAEFLRLSEQLSAEELFAVGADHVLAEAAGRGRRTA
jgi:hypothetical protein